MHITGEGVKSTLDFEARQNIPPDTFFSRYKPVLGEFVAQFGLDPDVAENLGDIVEATQPWVEGDHTRPENRAEVTERQGQRLQQLYRLFGIKQERPLPAGDYDQLIVLGAIHRGNNRRLDFLNRTIQREDITASQMVLLGGERPIYTEVEQIPIADNLKELRDSQITDPLVGKFIAGEEYPGHETDLLRLASAVQLDGLEFEDETEAYVRLGWRGVPVTITHTKAVQRPNGEPRHTTEACIGDFLKIIQPAKVAKVGFIATNPHIERTARTAERVLEGHGREDITLTPAGPAALDGYQHELYRGEVARLLFEDLLKTNTG